jgi:hypothetical protein
MLFNSRMKSAFLLLSLGILACKQETASPSEKTSPEKVMTEKSETVSPKSVPVSVVGTDSANDVQSLMDTIEARLRRSDTVGLVRLMVGDSAYRRHIFPTSSAFDSASEDAFYFVLGMHKANSVKGLRRVLAEVQRATEMQKPGDKPLVVTRDLDSLPVPGGMLYQSRTGSGIRPFGTALRVGAVCRIATFGHPGSSRE